MDHNSSVPSVVEKEFFTTEGTEGHGGNTKDSFQP
jgi:hypothetical protein